jgi:ABC-type branched-subunit amino acid transport system permease subunit
MPTRVCGDYFDRVSGLEDPHYPEQLGQQWRANGISKIGRPVIAGYELHTTLDFYYLIMVIVVITVFAMHRLIASRIGRAWIAIREDEIAAEAMGVNTHRMKLLAFVLGSAWAGIVGVFFSAKMAFVSPESFTFFESVMILCMVVLGGMGSIPGIILGALLLITIRDLQGVSGLPDAGLRGRPGPDDGIQTAGAFGCGEKKIDNTSPQRAQSNRSKNKMWNLKP